MESLLQTKTWAEFKARHGWQVVPFNDQFLLERSFPGKIKMLYGPEFSLPTEADELQKLVIELQKIAKSRHIFMTRLDFFTLWSDETAHQLKTLGLKKSFEEIQPEFRQWVDLKPELDTILAQMKQKGRYNIRLAARHGVTVTASDDPRIFTKLLVETAKRDGFAMRQPDYYHDLIKTLIKTNLGELLVATYQGQPLAAAIIGYSPNNPTTNNSSFVIRNSGVTIPPVAGHSWSENLGKSSFEIRNSSFASYLHGASSSTHREVMAPFLLHWKAIQRAKSRNCVTYDLLAVAPPTDGETLPQSPIANRQSLPHTKYAGITRFKEQFGGQTVRMLGAWDLIGQPLTYQIFRTLERLRRR